MAMKLSLCVWEPLQVDTEVVYNAVPSMGSKSHLLI